MRIAKIAVANFSGNVGKTTITNHLAAPRLVHPRVIPVETINADDAESERLRGKQFAELIEALAVLDSVVVDIGSSNIEDFVIGMRKYRGSHEDFDYFIVPTVPAKKQQRDTVATIEALAEMGVDAKKIRVVFNQVEPEDQVERVFAGIFSYAAEKTFTLRPAAVMHVNEIYPLLNGSKQSIAEILADRADLKVQLKAAKDANEKLRISRLIAIKRLAVGVTEELDAVFEALMS